MSICQSYLSLTAQNGLSIKPLVTLFLSSTQEFVIASVEVILTNCGFPPPFSVQGREAIANLFPLGKRCGIYVLHFADDRYYVGQSVDVTRRYVEHRKNHPDIYKISFKQVQQTELTAIEDELIQTLREQKVSLRNIRGVDPEPGLADFDLLMTWNEQERWLLDPTYVNTSGSRIIDPELRSKYRGKYQRFLQKPYSSDVIEVLVRYGYIALPRARAAEVSFWASSCLPAAYVYSRININWQEVLSVYTTQDVLCFSFHCACLPLDPTACLASFFGRFPHLTIDITIDEEGEYFLNAEGGEEYLQATFTPENTIISEELDKLLYPWFDETPGLLISNHGYKPGGDDQINFVMTGKEAALQFLQKGDSIRAIRHLNLRLMRKGPCTFRTSHCLELADHIIAKA